MRKTLELTGIRKGTLTVLKQLGLDNRNQMIWVAKCDCGKEIEFKAAHFQQGRVRCWICAKTNPVTSNDAPPSNVADAYFAGLFDGEGCVRLERRGRSHRIHIAIDCVFKPVLIEFQKRFGGSLTPVKRYNSERLCWAWRIRKIGLALNFLRTIVPFSMEKKGQIELAIGWLELRKGTTLQPPPEFNQMTDSVAAEISRLKRYEYLQ